MFLDVRSRLRRSDNDEARMKSLFNNCTLNTLPAVCTQLLFVKRNQTEYARFTGLNGVVHGDAVIVARERAEW